MDRPETTFGVWQDAGSADWQRWLTELGSMASAVGGPAAPAAVSGPAAGGFAALGGAGSAFARFAQDFARCYEQGQGTGSAEDFARRNGELQALAQRFHASAIPAWPALNAAGSEWPAALAAWSMVLADISRDSAARFAARLASSQPPATLRAAFDAWIDCAEAAFQAAAHSAAFAAAQARLINELVAVRGRQLALIEQGARALGLPTRSEVDGLHAAIRELRRGLDEARNAPPPRPAAPRTRRRGKRT
jgi:poly(hydroxyalkanoate) synthase III subunit E